MKPDRAGIHLAGENSFYASVRINMQSGQTDMLTSKGKTALGKLFYSVNTPDDIVDYEFINKLMMQTSVIATRDNTHVRISGYRPMSSNEKKLKFGGHFDPNYPMPFTTDDELNFILNKGESYTLMLWKKYNWEDLFDKTFQRFIGAKIESDKPITVTNGNFNSNFTDQYITAEPGNFVADQSLPVNRLGTEYYFQKGFSSITGNQDKVAEKVLVVATQDDTEVYLNDEPAPVAKLNEGDYYYNNKNYYQTEHFINHGMFVKTSKPSYVYQMTSGSDDWGFRGNAKSWFNLATAILPPLNRNLPNRIDYIPQVHSMGNWLQDVILQVVTPKGSRLSINGTDRGPGRGIAGSSDWQFHRIEGISGDLDFSSDGAVIAGFVGGYFQEDGISSAGFYTGFSNDPVLKVSGKCVQEGVVLSVSNIDFEGFQWQRDGVDIEGASSPAFIPALPGNYSLVLSYSGLKFTTASVEVMDCNYEIRMTDLGEICNAIIINPAFAPPNVRLEVDRIQILTPPYEGVAEAKDGIINIKINDGFSGANRVVFRITASNGTSEIVRANFFVNTPPALVAKSTLQPFRQSGSSYIYNLPEAIVNSYGNKIEYYKTHEDAENSLRAINGQNIYSYSTQDNEVYVKAIGDNGCFTLRKVQLLQPDLPSDGTVDEDELLPNVFTPNGDGINDCFDFSKLENGKDLIFKIVDRFGREVFHLNENSGYCWNGKTANGNPLPSSTYWVYYSYTDSEGNQVDGREWVFLKNRN